MGPKRSVDGLLVFAAIFSRKARTKFVLPVLVLGILMRNKVHSQLILGTQNEKCPSGNCTGGPAHKCGLVPKTTWLGKYVSPILKVCHCENLTMAGPYCDKECPHGRSNPCNGHGECIYSTATCACDFGWQGVNCTAKCPSTYGFVCASKGTCLPDGPYGAKCECYPGFRGGNCTIECKGSASRPCSKRGICEEDGSCTCEGGWRGEDCSIECPGSNIFPCNMRGKCTREALCECDPLYRGEACQHRCPDVMGIPCGGRGKCNSFGTCDCNEGFRGEDCMLECMGGASNPCSGHGTCLNSSACECSTSWGGEKCDEMCPGGLNNPCSGHGRCVTNAINRSSTECICDEGDGKSSLLRWEGRDCSQKVYNLKQKNTFKNMTSEVYKSPEIWPAIVPPLSVFLAIVVIIVTRLWTAYAHAQETRIKKLNAQIQASSGLEPVHEF